MADYPDISVLSALDVTTPAGSEVAAKLDDALRQLKKFVSTFLAVAHDDTGALKAGAVSLVSLADDVVTYAKIQNVSATDKLLGRATAGAGNIEEITCTTFARSLLDDADAATARATLALGAIALLATVGSGDIANAAVVAAKLASDAVTTVKILDANVTSGKLADQAVTIGKIGLTIGVDAAPTLIVKGTGAASQECLIGGVLTATVVAGVLTFALAGTTAPTSTAGVTIGYARLEEQRAVNTGAGGTTASTWVDRTGWVEATDGLDMVSVSGANITFKKKGVYLLDAWVPCSGAVGAHRARLYNVTGTTPHKIGTSCSCPAACTTYSHVREILETSADNQQFSIQTWATNSVATTGLGAPVNDTVNAEIYSILEIFKL